MKPERHVWEEDSTHRAVAGKEYDEVWDYAEQLEAENEALSELLSPLVDVELERDKLKAENDALREGLQERLSGSPEPDEDEGYTIFKNKHIRTLLKGAGEVMMNEKPAVDDIHCAGCLVKERRITKLEAENEALLKIKRAAKLYLEHGEPELADELGALLTAEKPETPISDVPITP